MSIVYNPFAIINEFRKTAPVDVEGLAHALGLKIRRANMSPDDSGEIEKIGPNNYVITVNENHSYTRQRFTIAHEISHFILHRNKMGDGISDNKLYRSNTKSRLVNLNIGAKEETEANQFAVNILMPFDLIKTLKEEGYSADQLAEKLEVSIQAIKIRLKRFTVE